MVCLCDRFPWAAAVPKVLFHEAVLPYANTNEARTNWRDLLWVELQPLMATGGPTNNSLAAAAMYLNQNMWSASVLGRHNINGAKITFHGEMTPRVYDPMSTILFGAVHLYMAFSALPCSVCRCRLTSGRVPVIQSGYASCTGVSILYVDALRTIGIPARVTGTPAWCDSKRLSGQPSHCEHIRALACLLSIGTAALAVHRVHRKVITIGSRYSLVRHTAGRRTSMAGRSSKRCQLAGERAYLPSLFVLALDAGTTYSASAAGVGDSNAGIQNMIQANGTYYTAIVGGHFDCSAAPSAFFGVTGIFGGYARAFTISNVKVTNCGIGRNYSTGTDSLRSSFHTQSLRNMYRDRLFHSCL